MAPGALPDFTLSVPPPQRGAARRVQRLAAAVTVLLLICLALSRPRPSAVVAADTTHLDTVRAEYGIMLDSYVKPLDPAALLTSAWDGATGLLRRRNVSSSTTLPQLPSDRTQAFAAFTTAWNALAAEAGASIDFTLVAFAADDAMAASVQDDHTFFLAPADYAADQQSEGGADSTQMGVGIESTLRPPHIVLDVAPESGAEQAGIRPGDIITVANGTDVHNAPPAAYLNALAGAEGDVIGITVQRPGVGSMDFQVVIGPYHFPTFSAKMLPNGVGYMRLRSFPPPWAPLENGENVVQQLDDALKMFEATGAAMWVLDLRDNAGGVSFTNQAFAGRFLADGKTDVDADSRGDRVENLVDGHPFPVQRPLAVLVNGLTGSSSEILASTLRDYGRAVLVGHRTAGGLGVSLAFPLPDGAGMHVTVATAVSGKYEAPIDIVGIAPDIPATQPSAEDLAAGRDPGIDAAVAALSDQQPFTVPPSTDATLTPGALRAALGPYEVTTAEVPTAPEIHVVHYFGDYVLDRYNQWNDWEGPGRDAYATRELAHQRGWQGALLQYFGEQALGAVLGVETDVYATPDGAAAAMAGTDFPDLLIPTSAPIQLGDQTIAFRGQWLDTGALAIVWRHGRLLLTVTFSTVPGEETFDPLVTLARAVEARYQASPLP